MFCGRKLDQLHAKIDYFKKEQDKIIQDLRLLQNLMIKIQNALDALPKTPPVLPKTQRSVPPTLKQKIYDLFEKDVKVSDIANQLRLNKAYVYNLIHLYKKAKHGSQPNQPVLE